MPTPEALTVYLFGITALAAGVYSLLLDPASSPSSSSLSSSSAPSSLTYPAACAPFAKGNSLAAIAMGLYYTLAAYQDNTSFFCLTVPMRLLTTLVFWSQGWTMPALWEGGGAILTGAALAWKVPITKSSGKGGSKAA